MRTRTWLTTAADQTPITDERTPDGERYVPGPELPSEPRVPGRHRRLVVLLVVVLVIVTAVAVVVIGEEAQRQDPAVPQVPTEGPDGQPELPES